jgi:hypothetical protein
LGIVVGEKEGVMTRIDVWEMSESPAVGWWFETMGEGEPGDGDEDMHAPVSLWEAEIAALTEDQLLAFTEAHEDE